MTESNYKYEGPKDKAQSLVDKARQAMKQSYSPYSGFSVGAAVLLQDGSIITGTNFENASYGLTLCAETVAVAIANNTGNLKNIVAIAIIGGKRQKDGFLIGKNPVYPCGRCRQILNEAAQVSQCDLTVYCASAEGDLIKEHKLSELIPFNFGPDDLGITATES
ncbi:cytidine deaminase [Zymomonas mobilis]|uniref:Cytidine deaminase n=1 Tax=Zymomonas mobilis subsp. pomaceae (strain ATCC 29192 / DSM 22645 / JCM 10191 / CCUG 17912 / NBRC 13757 / NCIMB 11200 / NRRL B-4491 / Barker I) TaxID=579138 RepID=F8EV16_ZYMMT|nr:cytidine deaminase [Zymomonas mobilis]AEI37304.1 cytidine deaminase [Zymomonas mobilis subsp. pomaceae ATCC 29192]MDX5948673.1 cytidine deaminase [Zymomonas mobilis subsp. pomaceae]GEB88478.1 cytidine deaminase [Zymomonas mobilis subsp. pomaceae]